MRRAREFHRSLGTQEIFWGARAGGKGAEAFPARSPAPTLLSASTEVTRHFRAGGWEGPVGEIRDSSEQGRLIGSTFSATVRRCGNGRHAGGASATLQALSACFVAETRRRLSEGGANRVEPEGPPTPSAR